MEHHHRSTRDSGATGRHVFRLVPGIRRVPALLLLAGAAIIGYGIYQHFQLQKTADGMSPEIRMPVTNSPLEPDRPDLLGEPRIDE